VHSFASRDIASHQNPTDVNGVRVHHLRKPFLLREEVRDAGLEEDTEDTTAKATELEYAKLCDINVYLELDDLTDALQILNQGLAINEKVYGKDHLATAACYNNIGAVMKAMGDNYEALEMLNHGLATFEKVYGKEHTATATAYTNIGSVMQAMGNNKGALEMYNQGLTIREKVLGKDHPDTAESNNNIALLKQAMGNTTPVSSHLRARRT
jgi:tetratricopeptide (TPR) repeat protein|tara:strand:+ start:110 stop:742 length:633 start_codon:yes stop_codon:yes gene_type:complete